MSNNYTVGPRVITRIILAMLFAVSGLASCGGGGSTTTTASNAAVISNTPTIGWVYPELTKLQVAEKTYVDPESTEVIIME